MSVDKTYLNIRIKGLFRMKEWDRMNMKTLAVNLKKEEAEAFRQYAEANNTTVASLLRGFIQSTLAAQDSPRASELQESTWGVPHILSYKNTDRLKRETAFHNPNNLNPDKLLNEILDRYFSFVEHVRK